MRYYDRFLDFCGALAGILILLVSVGIGIDVGFRIIDGQGVYWLIDVVEYALLVITFLGAPWVLRRGGHVSVDIVLMAFPVRVRQAIRRIMAVVAALICAVMACVGIVTAAEAYTRGTLIFKSLIFPEWWILMPMPVCMILCCVEFLRQGWTGATTSAELDATDAQAMH